MAIEDIIYVHKVRVNPDDGWGHSVGINLTILGLYKNRELAFEAKKCRDQQDKHTYFDVGKSWIEEMKVKDSNEQ